MRPATLLTISTSDGETLVTRQWHVTPCAAERLAAFLGEPHREWLDDAHSAATLAAAINENKRTVRLR